MPCAVACISCATSQPSHHTPLTPHSTPRLPNQHTPLCMGADLGIFPTALPPRSHTPRPPPSIHLLPASLPPRCIDSEKCLQPVPLLPGVLPSPPCATLPSHKPRACPCYPACPRPRPCSFRRRLPALKTSLRYPQPCSFSLNTYEREALQPCQHRQTSSKVPGPLRPERVASLRVRAAAGACSD